MADQEKPTEEKPKAEAPEEKKADEKPTEETKTDSKDEKKEEKKDKKESKESKSGSKSSTKRKGKVDLSEAKIGFLGAGKTADAIIRGLIQYGKVDPKRIHVSAKTTKNLETIKQKGCHITKRNYDIFAKYDCDIVFLCFHGSVIKECYKIGGSRPHPLTTNFIPNMKHPLYVLSLVSGVKLDQIRACLLNPEHPDKYMIEMHRLSISTACAYGLGITAIDVEPDSKKCSPLIRDMLSTISKLEYIPESQMDSACALGGNGLAFVYYFINSLADGAFKMGLNRQTATKFAAKTVQCAALTLLESGKHPSELKDSCTSPSGPAIYGIHVLDKADVASGVAGAVEAAHKRAKELAEELPN
ncbi:pyrroline-5-carboxylate reductase 3-like [Oppia nitens]|uniref:pyrroline-5-carboxylate reductase 3-like n=1 Tax=Oppia nitens TaxID=1686743 RepID=UPI0023DBA514|nr:pyrroline-5-carboxylate reductase 3-like [Oppia nitens]